MTKLNKTLKNIGGQFARVNTKTESFCAKVHGFTDHYVTFQVRGKGRRKVAKSSIRGLSSGVHTYSR